MGIIEVRALDFDDLGSFNRELAEIDTDDLYIIVGFSHLSESDFLPK